MEYDPEDRLLGKFLKILGKVHFTVLLGTGSNEWTNP